MLPDGSEAKETDERVDRNCRVPRHLPGARRGDCFRACPMTGPAGIGEADPSATAGAIVDLISGGAGNEAAVRWAEACSGSGYCIPACKHGINPRFMVQLARGFARRNAVGLQPT